MQDEMNDLQYTTEADPDVVKVVRCRDCKHYAGRQYGSYGKCNKNKFWMSQDDYCSYGEAKSDL